MIHYDARALARQRRMGPPGLNAPVTHDLTDNPAVYAYGRKPHLVKADGGYLVGWSGSGETQPLMWTMLPEPRAWDGMRLSDQSPGVQGLFRSVYRSRYNAAAAWVREHNLHLKRMGFNNRALGFF